MVVIRIELTTVLAGPILRKSGYQFGYNLDCNKSIFRNRYAAIYKINTAIPVHTQTQTTSIRAAQNLFIHLIQIEGEFPHTSYLDMICFFTTGMK